MQLEDKLKRDLVFSNNLLRAFERINLKTPYHLNVIDELHINENAHSRILYKLLSYKNEHGLYEILQSFIEFVKRKYHKDESKIESLKTVLINNPEITQEEQRIDLWIKEEGKYALIFENKVCGANDQEAQLYRYIEKTRNRGFKGKDEQIFIFYLPPTQDGEPSEQTWGNEKENFKNRYFKISFKEDILPWLENDIQQNTRHKDFILLTALTQYIDFLKGFFEIRNNNNDIKMEKEEIIKNMLGIKDLSNEEKVNSITKKIEELQDAINSLTNCREQILEEIKNDVVKNLENEIKKDFPNFNYCDTEYGGVYFDLGNKTYKLYIGFDGRWYCQLEPDSDDNNIKHEILDKSGVREILWLPKNYEGRLIWNYINNGDIEDAYKCMKDVLGKVTDFKEQ